MPGINRLIILTLLVAFAMLGACSASENAVFTATSADDISWASVMACVTSPNTTCCEKRVCPWAGVDSIETARCNKWCPRAKLMLTGPNYWCAYLCPKDFYALEGKGLTFCKEHTDTIGYDAYIKDYPENC